MHELDKVDQFLGIEIGTTYKTIIKHQNPAVLNQKLLDFGVLLDEFGMVPKNCHMAWKQLMQRIGVSARFWKDKNLLLPESTITSLEEQ